MQLPTVGHWPRRGLVEQVVRVPLRLVQRLQRAQLVPCGRTMHSRPQPAAVRPNGMLGFQRTVMEAVAGLSQTYDYALFVLVV